MKVKAWAVAGAVFALLSGCTTATPYQPLGQNRAASGGYFEEQIESNRFRVTFSGNSMTSRDTVERYLLYRAAELTRQRGYDWFVMADRNTERRSRTYVDRPFARRLWLLGPDLALLRPGLWLARLGPLMGRSFLGKQHRCPHRRPL